MLLIAKRSVGLLFITIAITLWLSACSPTETFIENETLPPAELIDSSSSAQTVAGTFYIRMDGGSFEQCTGQVDAPYQGSGIHQPCAWNHPFQALPPHGRARIAGGSILIIGEGSYCI